MQNEAWVSEAVPSSAHLRRDGYFDKHRAQFDLWTKNLRVRSGTCKEESWFSKSAENLVDLEEADEESINLLLGLIRRHPAGYLILSPYGFGKSPFEIIVFSWDVGLLTSQFNENGNVDVPFLYFGNSN